MLLLGLVHVEIDAQLRYFQREELVQKGEFKSLDVDLE